ncbi:MULTISPECIES: DNA starvation/stationary phase protection protein Dps [unclassified Saccharibacter]|uniref:DNA starvation/stationary phase protection protein Dps n=1 Tax=unclassified Saccharibacter TaxID=2648722 RepID=UPI00132BF951|nr:MULTISPECIES: DNA starvation/stationary phase protection protein Dps [unclassified Saccharibacter]MXV36758.1 DNA starvation/stationary phase protection protein Dps [Saccharibacter sp. EH611]MXV58250.1 DNA starvation/stationary phase protection protein Dps [Saccharibacter sp. EH70]MXV65706.1 DNA starvation/stationary phase protection protein Dps [Saccharibacter sp. EH60]
MSKINHYATQNNTADNTKHVSIETLNARLADLIDLALITKQAHWNLKGAGFIGVHEMLDGFRSEIDGHVDTAAERAVQLGGTALGTSQNVAEQTTFPAYPTDIYDVLDHVKALAERFATVANRVREAIKTTAEAGDDDTADIFTEISRGLDKNLWFLEAHTQDVAGPKK